MKQYTTYEQTAKLIELGFEKPSNMVYTQVAKRKIGVGIIEWEDAGEEGSYSIGELIEMLNGVSELEITRFGSGWGVYDELRAFTCEELIDALYDMIVKLKEEGVI